LQPCVVVSMYGVPPNLPLERFLGDSIFSITIDIASIYFEFGHSGTISVHGHWGLHNRDSVLIDEACEPADRSAYRVHPNLNQDVVNYSIDPPHSFSLRFSNEYQLTIYDNIPQYESFRIYPDDIIV
jgi:hypothetical protein